MSDDHALASQNKLSFPRKRESSARKCGKERALTPLCGISTGMLPGPRFRGDDNLFFSAEADLNDGGLNTEAFNLSNVA